MPSLTWIRSFEAAARHLSFTAAGNELGLTQAAVSQHIKALEQTVGRPLFVRLTRSLKLTDAGNAYFSMLQPLLDRIADGTESLFGGVSANRLVIRANAAFSVLWLAPRLTVFLDANPGLDVRIVNPVWPTESINEGADFEIRYGDGDWPGFVAERLTRDTLTPVARPDTGVDDLAACRLIHVLGYRNGWSDWLEAAGVEGVNHRRGLQCDNSMMALEAAADGAGVALARSSLVEGHFKSGRLVAPFETRIEAAEDYYLLGPAGKLGGAAAAFRDWLIEITRT
ncbi:MAG: LysR substrate-binding domain-containing protein [Rhodospirillales bacterium]